MKKYIISTYVNGCNINERFLASMETYAKKNKAELILLPTNYSNLSEEELENEYILKRNLHLNRNFLLSVLPLSPDLIDPLTGLNRLSSNTKSVIYASTKQRLKSVPSPSESLPRVIMTPGAVTHPTTALTKRGLISNKDHVFGAIVVDIVSRQAFHFRQVQANSEGSFVDLGKRYNSNGTVTNEKLEAIVPGDWHCGFTDPIVRDIILHTMDKYKPNYLILHDFFDGISVNHHIAHNILTRAKFSELNSLTKELKQASDELKFLSEKVKNVVIVKSNHDEFLDRWINEGNYVKDERNHVIGLELALAKAQGLDPLKFGLEKFNKFNNVKFLASDESFKVSKKEIECGVHGHLGANGSKGSPANLEICYHDIIYGHTHSPEILRNAWVVGTSSYLKLGYNQGPSSWMHSFCMVYEDGSRQLINVIKGKAIV